MMSFQQTDNRLYCSPLRHEAPKLSILWLIHQGGISHENAEVGHPNESHDRATRAQGETGRGDLPGALQVP